MWEGRTVCDHYIVVWLFCGSQQLHSNTSEGFTNITVFPVSSQEVLDLTDERAAFVVFYATGPVVLASGYEHLLGVGGHGAIKALLTLDVQARRRLSTLACWRRAALNRRYWWRRERDVDALGVASAG